MNYVYSYPTKIGKISIYSENNKITALSLEDIKQNENFCVLETLEIKEAFNQIKLYLDGKLKRFNLPIYFNQTAFRNKVYEETLKIKYGDVITYKELATRIGNPLASRAVGNALNKNKIMIIIPCHRVVGQKNNLTGYYYGIGLKQKLLNLEKNNKD